MQEIYRLLPVLGIVMLINIALGTYSNIKIEKFSFDIKKFFAGIIKAVIIAASAVGLSYAFTVIDLSSIGVTPETIITAAIIGYAKKDIDNFARYLNVNSDEVKPKGKADEAVG